MNSSSVYFARKAVGTYFWPTTSLHSCWLLGPRCRKFHFPLSSEPGILQQISISTANVKAVLMPFQYQLRTLFRVRYWICLHPGLKRACFLIVPVYWMSSSTLGKRPCHIRVRGHLKLEVRNVRDFGSCSFLVRISMYGMRLPVPD